MTRWSAAGDQLKACRKAAFDGPQFDERHMETETIAGKQRLAHEMYHVVSSRMDRCDAKLHGDRMSARALAQRWADSMYIPDGQKHSDLRAKDFNEAFEICWVLLTVPSRARISADRMVHSDFAAHLRGKVVPLAK
jgi:hypothetical protein